jgi:hypothetical protein
MNNKSRAIRAVAIFPKNSDNLEPKIREIKYDVEVLGREASKNLKFFDIPGRI